MLKNSSAPLAACTWRAATEGTEKYIDPATEYWGLAFARHSDGTYSAALVGPSLKPRTLKGLAGEQYWGVDFTSHAYVKDVGKQVNEDSPILLPTTGDQFMLAGKRYHIPHFECLEAFTIQLIRDGTLKDDTRILRSLNGREDFSERSRQRCFKKVTGLSKKQILQLRQARYAFSLLQGGLSLAAAAVQAGYTDQSHLTHTMKRLYAKTPKQIRRARAQSM